MRNDVTLENDEMLVSIAAHDGGRVTRLANKRDQREWLVGPPLSPLTPAVCGDIFTETGHFGWDEMLPTVDPCKYVDEPYAGVKLPDHGELWTAQWSVEARSATSLHQQVSGRIIAFTFDRLLTLRGSVLRCDYRCVTPVDTAMLWALHPQFATLDGTSLRIHPEPLSVVDVSNGVPEPRSWSGDLVVERDIGQGHDLMMYADPATTIWSASLCDPDGSSLEVTWDTAFARYLGVWADRGRYSRDRVVAIEPTNGFFDELTRAATSGRVTEFRADVPVQWWVEIALEPGKRSGL